MNSIIESKRIYLRSFRPSDYTDLYEYLSLEEVVKYEPYSVLTLAECHEEVIKRSKNNSYYAIILKSENKLIGNVYFAQKQPYRFRTYELGYILNPKYQHQGYATEATETILNYGFSNMKIHRVIANCNQENLSSINLLERLGMRREQTSKKDIFFHYSDSGEPIWLNNYMYAILEEEFFAKIHQPDRFS